jgi:alkylhydroperoxidase/carboxymuconolactone decarboxylase family protein YurZ
MSAAVSEAFQTFMNEASQQASAFRGMIDALAASSALDAKTASLAYLAVLAALRLNTGIPFHVQIAKRNGATRDEIIAAVLVGLPAAGIGVTSALPIALTAFDA